MHNYDLLTFQSSTELGGDAGGRLAANEQSLKISGSTKADTHQRGKASHQLTALDLAQESLPEDPDVVDISRF